MRNNVVDLTFKGSLKVRKKYWLIFIFYLKIVSIRVIVTGKFCNALLLIKKILVFIHIRSIGISKCMQTMFALTGAKPNCFP